MELTSVKSASSFDKYRLLLLSFLMLFIELVLIRWSQANILYLAYFSNFILLGSFLGMGIGFIYENNKLYELTPLFLLGFVIFITHFPVRIEIPTKDLLDKFLIFSNHHVSGLPPWFTMSFIFLMTAMTMACIANGVAATFAKFAPLQAYRLDILGSLMGIVTFFILSFLNTPPIVWTLVIFLLFAILLFNQWRQLDFISIFQVSCLILLVIVSVKDSFTPNIFWSPYSKIMLHHFANNTSLVSANGVPHQLMEPSVKRFQLEPFYWAPYQHRVDKTPPQNILIIGAGTGSDVAIGLTQGAASIDAVEIDPILYKLGQKHPDKPYNDPRVHIMIDDGRAFLQRTHQLYDMIIFALPDSHVLLAGQSSLRLESYLLTKESLEAVKKHLAPNGVFAAYNYYIQPWVVDRLANTMFLVFKKPPCVDTHGVKLTSWSVLTTSLNPNALICPSYWNLATTSYSHPATDDHPFFYLKENVIPKTYQVMLGSILLITIIIFSSIKGVMRSINVNLDLFFLGIAFLLLETKSISTFALLFGTTWMVNALVFMGILLSIYIAIEISSHFSKIRFYFLYAILGFSLFLAWYIPTNSLLSLSTLSRFVIGSILTFSPIIFANLIFANRFQSAYQSTCAFGTNLLGAMFGGTLEYSALVLGYRDLLIIIAIVYGLAFILTKKSKLTAIHHNL